MLRINNITCPIDFPEENLISLVEEKLGGKWHVLSLNIIKKAIDARKKSDVHYVLSIDIKTEDDENVLAFSSYPFIEKISVEKDLYQLPKKHCKHRPVIVGSGPGGMLAGIALAEAGLEPIILERGCCLAERQKDVQDFWNGGALKENSNVQFGEGGAGTFSDGKLMSGIKKDKYTAKVLSEFVAAGAPEEILYLAKPHVGTDKLAQVVLNIRKKIISLGGEYRFENKLEDLVLDNGRLSGIKVSTADGRIYELSTDKLILAIGHSARDTFEMLYRNALLIEPKPFSIGARIEHKQSLINKSQYGHFSSKLGAADYKLAFHAKSGRSAYTFCMCPGGVVVAAASEKGRVVTNGMSEYARNGENANAALLVGVNPADFSGDSPLKGMYWQREIEEKAFILGGKNYKAPAQLVGDFLQNKASVRCGDVCPTYRPGVAYGDLHEVLPTFITDTMKAGLLDMDKRLHGFASYDAVLTGVETRSSSPIRICRDESFQSTIRGIYPCGEGAGYAGGIMSAAADGLKCAEKLVESLS